MIREYVRWLYRWFETEVLAIPGRVIALLFFVLLFIFPVITTSPYVLYTLTIASMFAIYAASWDLLSGYTGQLNLGHALFFGVAAYTSALLNKHLNLPPWITIPAGGISALLVGLLAGIPALRLRGFYLALVTLSFPIILLGIVNAFPDFTGGELGIYGLAELTGSPVADYYLVLIIMIFCVFVMHKFTDTESKIVRIGLLLHAIREDEIAARASGIDTTRYKLMAFGVSGFLAGIAGGLYAHFVTIAGPSNLQLFFSFQVILWCIFGGIRTIYGAVAGVFILFPLVQFLPLFEIGEQIRYMLFSLILILTLLFMPEGLSTWVRDKIEINCPRCKLVNKRSRRICRACRAPLHLEQEAETANE